MRYREPWSIAQLFVGARRFNQVLAGLTA